MRAFIGLGSNIDPADNICKAIKLLKSKLRIRNISTVYLTKAIGSVQAPDFYNCVLEIDTSIPPRELKKEFRQMERELGRTRTKDKYAPRVIDIDLLLYDGVVLEEADIKLPDPDIEKRPFLAAGIAELAPDIELPGNVKIRDLVRSFAELKPLLSYTRFLRKEISNGPEKS